MVEPAADFHLTFKARYGGRARPTLDGQQLDRNHSLQFWMLSLVDNAHTAFTDFFDECFYNVANLMPIVYHSVF